MTTRKTDIVMVSHPIASWLSLSVYNERVITANLDSAIFPAAKVHVTSGMVIVALAVTAAQQMCKKRKVRKNSSRPANSTKK